MITLKNVSKWYGHFQVLTDCSTEVKKGEVVVVCGPSGLMTRKPIWQSCVPASGWCSSILSCHLVTHEMGFARKVANRVIFMDEGKIVEDSPKDAFFDDPKSDRAKDFLAKILH